MRSSRHRPQVLPPILYDRWFLILLAFIIFMGLIMMASASIVISEQQTQQPFYYLLKQLVYLTMGVVIGVGLMSINTKHLEQHSGSILLIVIFMLGLVLIPGIGHRVNGSARWLGVGPFVFQVSELVKLATVIYMAGYLLRRNQEIRTSYTGFVKPMMVLAILALLLLKEPDFGATVVIAVTILGMLFMAGMRLRYFAILIAVLVGLLALVAISEPYRLLRLTSFLNPWAKPFDSGYQLTQSLIAFGRGGWFGVGLGKSVQKMFYLPEAHTDFLFAVIAEELGLIGVMFLIILFVLLILRIFVIGRQAERLGRHYAGYIAYGFGFWVAIQFMVNIGVNIGLLPTKGLTLPLMSYGGSSVLVNCMVMAILLRIDHENRLQALGVNE